MNQIVGGCTRWSSLLGDSHDDVGMYGTLQKEGGVPPLTHAAGEAAGLLRTVCLTGKGVLGADSMVDARDEEETRDH